VSFDVGGTAVPTADYTQSGADTYTATSGTVSFAAGDTMSTVTITPSPDTLVEGNETVQLTVVPGPGYTAADPEQAEATIVDEDVPSVVIVGPVAALEGDTGTHDVLFEITLTQPVAVNVSVDYMTQGGTATVLDQDYQSADGTIVFQPGEELTQIVNVTVNGDEEVENDEEFSVRLTNLVTTDSTVILATESAQAVILNDDTQVTVAVAPPAVTEDGFTSAEYTFTRTGDTSGVLTVDFTVGGSAALGADYTPGGATTFSGTSGTITFTAGAGTAKLTIDPLADDTVEDDETVVLTVVSGTGYVAVEPISATATITNDDTSLSIASTDAEKAEGDASTTGFVFTVTRTGLTAGSTTVDYAVTPSGANPADAADFGGALPSGQISFAAGETSKTITVDVSGDTAVEPDEEFTVVLSNASGDASIITAEAAGTITNDDTAIAMEATDAVKAEGDSGTTAFTFTVTRTGVTTGTSTVDYAVMGSGTDAADAADFGGALPNGQITFAADETSQTITVDVAGDVAVEPDEEFTVVLSNASGSAQITTADASGTITNDDAELSIEASDAVKAEGDAGNTAFTFTVTRTGVAAGTATVDYTVAGSGPNAADAADFGGTLPSGQVSFGVGETSKTIAIDVSGDSTAEPDEGFTVTLFNVSGEARIGTDAAAGTIVNDDAALSIAAADAVKAEGDSGITAFTFTVTRTGMTTESTTVDYAIAGSGSDAADAADFGGALPGGQVTLAAGEESETVAIEVSGDIDVESNESFTVTLSNASGNVQIIAAEATGTIVNDDTALAIEATDAVKAEEDTGLTAFTFTVTRAGVTSGATTVDFAVTGSGTNPANGADFGGTLPSGQVGFAADEISKTITVDVSGDLAAEPDEGFAVTLSNASGGARIAVGDSTGTILNDDTAVSIDATDAVKSEGDSGTVAFTFTVTRTGVTTGTTTVDYAVAGSGAEAADAADFGGSLPSGQVSFAAGETSRQITVEVSGDTAVEADEEFTVTLSNASAETQIATPTAAGTIVNDDGEVSVTVTPGTATEDGSTNLDYVFARTGLTTGTLTVSFSVGGSATFNADYSASGADTFSATAGTVTFAAGSSTVTVTVDPTGDALVESDETVTLTLTPGSGYHVATPNVATSTILDNDTAFVAFGSDSGRVIEFTGSTSLTVVLAVPGGGSLTKDLTVNVVDLLSGSADTPADYSLDTTQVTFTAGSSDGTTRSVDLTIVDDDVTEDLAETIHLELQIADDGLGSQVTIGSPGQHTVNISDDPLTGGASGVVWADTNNNGVKDIGEAPIPGVTITVVGVDLRGDTVEFVTVTDSTGAYNITGLPGGTFDIVQTHPLAFHDGFESLGTVDGAPSGTVGDDRFTGVVLQPTEQAVNYDFGERGLRARYVNVRMLLASTPEIDLVLRDAVADAEQMEGDPDRAEAIRLSSAPQMGRIGSEVRVTGGAADDAFEFTPAGSASASAASAHSVTVNDVVWSFDASEVDTFFFDAGLGKDTVQLFDTAGNDTLEAAGNTVSLFNEDVRLDAIAFELARAISESGGDDQVQQSDIEFDLELEGDWEQL
jgi:hypothetical protein